MQNGNEQEVRGNVEAAQGEDHPDRGKCLDGTSLQTSETVASRQEGHKSRHLVPNQHGTSTNCSGTFARDVGNASRSLTRIITRILSTDAHLSLNEMTTLDGLDVIVSEYIRAREQEMSTKKIA